MLNFPFYMCNSIMHQGGERNGNDRQNGTTTQAADHRTKAYEPKVIPLITGEDMLVREITRDEVPLILETIEPLMKQPKDFYDIVAARIYAELLGMYRYRVQDEYFFVGAIDGEIAGIVNGRLVNEKIGMSYHTMTLRRGLR